MILNNKGFSNILVISLVLVLLVVGGYFGFSYFKKPEVSNSTSENTETQPENENLKYLIYYAKSFDYNDK